MGGRPEQTGRTVAHDPQQTAATQRPGPFLDGDAPVFSRRVVRRSERGRLRRRRQRPTKRRQNRHLDEQLPKQGSHHDDRAAVQRAAEHPHQGPDRLPVSRRHVQQERLHHQEHVLGLTISETPLRFKQFPLHINTVPPAAPPFLKASSSRAAPSDKCCSRK